MQRESFSYFFKHEYDPTEEQIRRLLPSYRPMSREQWRTHFEENCDEDPVPHVRFTLQKLRGVTTSYRLTESQRQSLQGLLGGCTWREYCSVMEPRQMEYVGV